MAKETPFATAAWHSSPPPSFFNLNSWDHSSDFESALSSLVSSPTSADPSAGGLAIHELIGRLGTISNYGELAVPQFAAAPLAPPPLSADPGFVERAARFSCFAAGGMAGQFGLPEAGRMSRVSSSHSLMAAGSQLGDVSMPERSQLASEEPSAAGLNSASNPRKRKTASKTKAKDNPSPKVREEESNAKRSKSTEVKPKDEKNGGEASGNGGDSGLENNAKPPEPPKQDYIHVRARRGQATDSHSLAERVRRERISERMKLLQDLVPGCNKITGKALMLDEIINYVQSLQRQVEFLSMKLSTVNTRLDFNMDNFFPKDMQQLVYPIQTAAMTSMYAHQPQSAATNGLETQCSVDRSDANLRRALCMQLPPLDGFGEAASQLGNFWEDDLQSVVQMGLVQNKEAAFSSNNYFQGSLPSSQMKIEL